MTIPEIINSETLTADEKITLVNAYIEEEAVAFLKFVNPYGVFQESLYGRYLGSKSIMP